LSLDLALKALMNLGLSQVDATVYVYLSKNGPSRAEAVVRGVGIRSQQVLRSLRTLEVKGFVTSKNANQTVFSAVLLEKIIDSIIRTKTLEAKRLEENKQSFLSKN
jgi:sugar-specific transcriptional regulator TrmB